MSENPNSDPNPNPAGPANTGGDAWDEVGSQFKVLGESLAQAFRTAWENEHNQARVQEMRNGLELIVRNVDQAIQDTAASPEGQRIRSEADRAAESLRSATEKTVQEARPHLVSALRQVNDELQKFIDRMSKDENRKE